MNNFIIKLKIYILEMLLLVSRCRGKLGTLLENVMDVTTRLKEQDCFEQQKINWQQF